MRKTDKQMWEKQAQNQRVTKIEVDNGVHPLHWATSLGPSSMGTDPINLLKWYKNGFGINFSNCKHNVVQSL